MVKINCYTKLLLVENACVLWGFQLTSVHVTSVGNVAYRLLVRLHGRCLAVRIFDFTAITQVSAHVCSERQLLAWGLGALDYFITLLLDLTSLEAIRQKEVELCAKGRELSGE